jgi:hypothetical protein
MRLVAKIEELPDCRPDQLHATLCGHPNGETGIDAGQKPLWEAPAGTVGNGLVLVVEHAVDGARRGVTGDGVIDRGRKAVDVGPRPLRG